MEFSLYVIVIITSFLAWATIQFLVNLFKTIFDDLTETEQEIRKYKKQKSFDPSFKSIDISLKSSENIDFTIVVKCKATTVPNVVEQIREVRNKLSSYGYDSERTEIIYLVDPQSVIHKRVGEISMKIKNIRFLGVYNDPFQEFRRCMLMANGKYVINSQFIDKEIPKLKSYPDNFVVIAQPSAKITIPYYDPITFSFPIFATKDSGITLYSRIHIRGVKATPELIFLCNIFNVPVFIKKRHVKCYKVGPMTCVIHRLVKKMIPFMYKIQQWTPTNNN